MGKREVRRTLRLDAKTDELLCRVAVQRFENNASMALRYLIRQATAQDDKQTAGNGDKQQTPV